MATFVSSERRDAVALVTIDNPPMNALSAALLEELEAELDALDADDGVRAIVLRGAGDRAFVAGADIKEFPALRESASEGGSARGIQQVGRRMDAARTPFVAAIRGGEAEWDKHDGSLGLRRAELIDACYRSAESGHEVSLA